MKASGHATLWKGQPSSLLYLVSCDQLGQGDLGGVSSASLGPYTLQLFE